MRSTLDAVAMHLRGNRRSAGVAALAHGGGMEIVPNVGPYRSNRRHVSLPSQRLQLIDQMCEPSASRQGIQLAKYVSHVERSQAKGSGIDTNLSNGPVAWRLTPNSTAVPHQSSRFSIRRNRPRSNWTCAGLLPDITKVPSTTGAAS